MEYLFFVILFFVFLIPLVLGMVIPIYKNHYKTGGDIVNYDSYMRKFVYKVPMAKDNIITTLRTTSIIDDLSCVFDFSRDVIDFREYGSHREYYFNIIECDGFCILKLQQVALIGMSSHIQLKLNPFIVKKLNAEIVPFSQYAF